MDFTDPRSSAGAAPISADAPSGVDARETPAFEALEADVRKMDADGPLSVRWASVVADGLVFLRGQSKDLLVAAWVTYGLARQEGYRGLATGLGLVDGMLQNHWDGLFPPQKRERARIAALDWLFERLAGLFTDREPEAGEGPAVTAASEALASLVAFIDDKLPGKQIATNELQRMLVRRADAVHRMEAPAQDTVVAPLPTAAAATAVPAAPAVTPAAAPRPIAVSSVAALPSGADAAEIGRAIGQIETNLRQVAAALREADPTDPRAYVLARTAAWLPVQQVPPHTDRRTLVAPPSAERLVAITALAANGRPRDALLAIEATASTAVFWLDGQRLAVETLAALGAEFGRAREAVTGLVVAFVRRFPVLLDLSFANGDPFAGPATRRWLEESAGLGAPAGGNAADGGEVATIVAEANTLADASRGREAMALLAQAIRATAVGRERFLLRLAQAELGLAHAMVPLALELLTLLADEADALGLEDWEPELAARASELWLRALAHPGAKSMSPDLHRQASDRARSRLTRTDAATAARYLS